ncbi:hypothetical protein J2X45_003897 [Caulobacter sp. BE264]|uniref:NUMOD4 motif-containing HNH endonuclease n=1 Tax=Caulobacter sp. BE264 TaxID=2817724 RepID=UPI002865135E|nr:NUMOD4 motif-containing HNH endonuclease [Caulobacter sp. BE264]MDR7232787.1 hypothetical protein [Caulobacter sp. BE264]
MITLPDGVYLDLSDEQWRPVPGEDLLASDRGRIARPNGKVLALGTDRNGYRFVRLYRNGRCSSLMVGPLVCAAFHGLRPSADHQADHIDSDRTNNSPWNLRWLTRSENLARASTTKGRKLGPRAAAVFGEDHPSAKLSASDVRAIRARYRKGSRDDGLKALARTYGVAFASIAGIVTGRTWKHLEDGVRNDRAA